MSNLIIVVAFGGGFLLIFAINMLFADLSEARRRQLRERLEEEFRLQQRERARGSLAQRELYELAAEGYVDLKQKKSLRERLSKFLAQSGTRVSAVQLFLFSFVAAAVAAGITGGLTRSVVAASLAGLTAACIPALAIALMRRRRTEKLQSQLPDAFELMARVMRAGQTVSQALQAVADEFSEPVSQEFGYCYEQQNLGLSPEAAMRDLSNRAGLLEMKIFVLAVMVHRQTGGNLSDLLDKLGSIIRSRYQIRAKIKALTTEGRMQAIILLGLPPLLLLAMLFLNRPYAMVLFQYPLLLVATFVSMLFGAIWMNRIIDFDF